MWTQPPSTRRWQRQKEQARAAGKFKMAANLEYAGPATTFHGYETLERTRPTSSPCTRTAARCNELNEGETRRGGAGRHAVLRRIRRPGRRPRRAAAARTASSRWKTRRKYRRSVFGHHGVVKTGKLTVGDGVTASVDAGARAPHHAQPLGHPPDAQGAARSAGQHVQQKGSLVDPDKTRFDFVHTAADDRRARSARWKRSSTPRSSPIPPTQARVMPIEEAQKTGAMMLFGEKYGDEVRVLDIGIFARTVRRHPRESAPATSACSRSWRKAASPPACAASRR